ncbi:MAG: hypothetical protein N2747_04340 [Chitinophagaceae bacterium]|nr:hypothetical protein [Chitinophagaceae bacterium]
MRRFMFFMALFMICHFYLAEQKNSTYTNTVNAVIGDISYKEKYGIYPNSLSDETDRIQTHLLYVEKLLRKKDISHLSEDKKKQRKIMLDLLREYA